MVYDQSHFKGEIHLFLGLVEQERFWEDSVGQRHSTGGYEAQGNMKLFHAKMKVNTYTVCEVGLSTEEEDGEIGVLAIYVYHCSGVFCLL